VPIKKGAKYIIPKLVEVKNNGITSTAKEDKNDKEEKPKIGEKIESPNKTVDQT
jgi:hypothetical protein